MQKLELSKDKVSLFVRVLEGRRAELINAAKQNTVSQISASYLQDFDWKVHLVLASDKCSNLREPSLLLNLYIKRENEEKAREVLIELTKDELDQLLVQFDKIQSAAQKLII